MRLSTKIITAQLVVTLLITAATLMLMPELIYRNFSQSVQADVASYSTQIISNIGQKLTEIKRVTNVLESDSELKSKINDYMDDPSNAKASAISLYLSGFYLRESLPSYTVLGVYISMDDSETSFKTVGFSDEIRKYIDNNVDREQVQQSDGLIISPFEYSYDSSTIFANEFNMVYGYSLPYKVGTHTGVLTVVSPYSDIGYLLDGVEDFATDYVLVDGYDRVLYSHLDDSDINVPNTMRNIQYGDSYQIAYVNDQKGFSVIAFTSYGNWRLICRLTRDEILASNSVIFRFAVIIIIGFEVLANAITIVVSNRVLRPLQEVSRKMRDVAKGNIHVRIAYQSQDEVGDVVESFNVMTRKLEKNIQELVAREQIEQRLRYGILISKVDPHFIYNTMNTITYLAEKGRSKDVIVVNQAMIAIMRDRLRIELTDVFDTIEQEISVLQQYIVIQQYRFEGMFKYCMDVPEDVCKLYIAKSVIQPIIENALLHGILTNRDDDGELLGGRVQLQISSILDSDNKQWIKVRVQDNGSGMTEERLHELMNDEEPPHDGKQKMFTEERGKHVGIRNVQDRLHLLYGGQAMMEIHSILGEGTTVEIQVPVMSEKEIKSVSAPCCRPRI